jgi:hypothetical protein
MAPETGLVHLAEVFSSGLLREDHNANSVSDPEDIHYEFENGIR